VNDERLSERGLMGFKGWAGLKENLSVKGLVLNDC